MDVSHQAFWQFLFPLLMIGSILLILVITDDKDQGHPTRVSSKIQ